MFLLLIVLAHTAHSALITNLNTAMISNIDAALANAVLQNVPTISRSIDSIFYRLPSQENLQTIILRADALGFTQLEQVIEIKGVDIPCQALSAYSD